MRCALLCKKYIPHEYDECVPQFHELTVFKTTRIPEGEGFKGLMISTGVKSPINTALHVYNEDQFIFDESQNSELLSFRSMLSLVLENIFPGKASFALEYFKEKGSMDYLLCYVIYYDSCDIYVHPDALSDVREKIIKPMRERIERGFSFVREDMLSIRNTSSFLSQYSRDRGLEKLISPIQIHLFFPSRKDNFAEKELSFLDGRLKEIKDDDKKDLVLEVFPNEYEKGLISLGKDLLAMKSEIKYGTTTLLKWNDITEAQRKDIIKSFTL